MSNSTNQCAVLIEAPALSSLAGKEGVDLALVCAAFELKVQLIFVGDGIFHLLNDQNSDYFSDKMHDKQLKALEFYEIDPIYAELESLNQFGLKAENLLSNVTVIERQKIQNILQQSERVVTF